jgi:hypothetical protein
MIESVIYASARTRSFIPSNQENVLESEISVFETRLIQAISPELARGSVCGKRERGLIEPSVVVLVCGVRIGSVVLWKRVPVTPIRILSAVDGEWIAGRENERIRELPAADDSIHKCVVVQELIASPEGKLI